MSDFARHRRVFDRWCGSNIAVGKLGLGLWAAALALISLALSIVTVTARSKLWLGPQTVVLVSVGLCVGVAIALPAWHFARARGAEALDRPLLSRRGLAAVILACTDVASAILYFAFARFPNSADEYGFLFEADTFRHLRLWNPLPPDPVLFEQNLIVARDGIWISQYLPGWPAILALFELAHLPPWSGAPVCGALLLLLLWTSLRLECRSSALTVALLLAYASSDFFLLNSATYFSHCASALTVVGGDRVHAAAPNATDPGDGPLPPAPALAWHCCAGSTAPRWPASPRSPPGSNKAAADVRCCSASRAWRH